MINHDATARMQQALNRNNEIAKRKRYFMELDDLIDNIRHWHNDRNLIEGSTDAKQCGKLEEEFNELKDSINANESPIDDIGDMIVVLINIAERNNLDLIDCVNHAWNDIKDRKGKMIDGIFVKEADLNKFE